VGLYRKMAPKPRCIIHINRPTAEWAYLGPIKPFRLRNMRNPNPLMHINRPTIGPHHAGVFNVIDNTALRCCFWHIGPPLSLSRPPRGKSVSNLTQPV
jgi:hypothetical protein